MKTKSIIIDVVFTWVDGKDEKYRDKLLNYIPKEKSKNNEVRALSQVHEIEYAVKSIYTSMLSLYEIFLSVTAESNYQNF